MSYLDDNQIIEKKKLINKMKREIVYLENKRNHINYTNYKIRLLRRIRMSLCASRVIAPYVLSLGLLFGGFSCFEITPFFKDSIKNNLHSKKIFDSLGNISIESQYDNYDNSISTITYYDRWVKEDDLYTRNIKTYDVDNVDENTILNALNSPNSFNLDAIFGDKETVVTEKKNNLSLEESNSNPYWQVILYTEDKNDYVYTIESNSINTSSSILFIIVSIVVEILILDRRSKRSSFDYKNSIENIKKKYSEIKINELDSKIKIKKANYDRLVK